VAVRWLGPLLKKFEEAVKRFRHAKAAQKALNEAFKARGHDFMAINSTVHEAMVKEAMATSVEATMAHFDRAEAFSMGRAWVIIDHYKERSKRFDPPRRKINAKARGNKDFRNYVFASSFLTLALVIWVWLIGGFIRPLIWPIVAFLFVGWLLTPFGMKWSWPEGRKSYSWPRMIISILATGALGVIAAEAVAWATGGDPLIVHYLTGK
jgi:hypothetical protein